MRPGDPLASDYPVESLHDLIAVVTSLWTDLQAHPDEWENPTLEEFQRGMAAWLATFPQMYVNLGKAVPQPEWQFVADVLRAARVYEKRTELPLGVTPFCAAEPSGGVRPGRAISAGGRDAVVVNRGPATSQAARSQPASRRSGML